jgi:single-strand DNA-binding protein
MNDMNLFVVEGNFVADPEVTTTPSGARVVNFSIGVNRSYKKGDSFQDESSFFDVEAWGKLADVIGERVKKGMRTRVEGRLKQQRWTNSDGQSRSRVVLVASSADFVWPKREDRANTAEESVNRPVMSDSTPSEQPPMVDEQGELADIY